MSYIKWNEYIYIYFFKSIEAARKSKKKINLFSILSFDVPEICLIFTFAINSNHLANKSNVNMKCMRLIYDANNVY